MKSTNAIRILLPSLALAVVGCGGDPAVPQQTLGSEENTDNGTNPDQPVTQKAPNVLVICCDQLSAWTLGCYGGNTYQGSDPLSTPNDPSGKGTPNIDRIAREGVRMTGFYANTPVSTPSRGAFQTGLYPCEDGAYQNNIQLKATCSTWAKELKNNGYSTGFCGKWHLNGGTNQKQFGVVLTGDAGNDMGWADHFFLYEANHPKDVTWQEGSTAYPTFIGDIATNPANYPTDFFTDRAIAFMGAHKAGKFCYMLSIPDPHPAYSVRNPYSWWYPQTSMVYPPTFTEDPKSDYTFYWDSRKKGSTIDDGTGTADEDVENKSYTDIYNNLKANKSQYFGEIKCIDDNIGKILHWLDSTKLIDNTIIVLTADHGDMMGEQARMAKGVPFEPAARVPFLIRYPAKLAAGKVCDIVASTVDFYPTILSLTGVKQTATGLSGKDMTDWLEGNKDETAWDNTAFMRAQNGQAPWIAVVTKDYKLIYSSTDTKVSIMGMSHKGLLIDRNLIPGNPEESESYNCFDPATGPSDPRYGKSAAYQAAINELTPKLVDYCRAHSDWNWSGYTGTVPKGITNTKWFTGK